LLAVGTIFHLIKAAVLNLCRWKTEHGAVFPRIPGRAFYTEEQDGDGWCDSVSE